MGNCFSNSKKSETYLASNKEKPKKKARIADDVREPNTSPCKSRIQAWREKEEEKELDYGY